MRTFHKINNLKVCRTRPGDEFYRAGNPWTVFTLDGLFVAQFQRETSAVNHAKANLNYVGGTGPYQILMSSNLQHTDVKTFVRNLKMAWRLSRWYVNQSPDGAHREGWIKHAVVSIRKTRKNLFRLQRAYGNRAPTIKHF